MLARNRLRRIWNDKKQDHGRIMSTQYKYIYGVCQNNILLKDIVLQNIDPTMDTHFLDFLDANHLDCLWNPNDTNLEKKNSFNQEDKTNFYQKEKFETKAY